MVRELLRDSDGCKVYPDAGESAVIVATLLDVGVPPVAIAKGVLQTLTLTLVNGSDLTVINGRDGQDVLDANDGTVSADGVVTIKLGPDDNPIVGSTLVGTEDHFATLRWTWVDGDGDTLSGAQQWLIQVLASP